ncbi:hypothetical protein BBJ28_00016247 [Nothophytophthora sp. Chile5]|nr:hypothetical protein BBJ28_00016247 [Nothophytophthora sp. Chile5]
MDVTDPDVEENPSIAAISGAWEASLTNSNLKGFNHRGYLSYDLDENLVVLTLNTVPYSPDPFDQFKWLNTSLLELRNSSKFAFIVGHIPPIIDSYSGSALWNAAYIETYKQIVGDFSDVVKAQIFGHVHSIEFRLPLTADQTSQSQDVVGSDMNDTGSSNLMPLFMSAAISPIFRNNPAFMTWDFDTTTYELLDFAVYGTNISENSQELDWQLLFNASTAYGVDSLSWSEMNGFVERATADPELLEQYYYNSKAQSYQQIMLVSCLHARLLAVVALLVTTPELGAMSKKITSTSTSTSVGDNSGLSDSSGSGSSSSSSVAGGDEVGVKHILHFSDVHLNISESLDASASAEIPIAYGVDAPITLLTLALEYAQRILPEPDLFLFTGDHAVHDSPSEEYLVEAVKTNVETLTKYFSATGNDTLSVTAILGDTDSYPAYTLNVTDPDTQENPSIAAISGAWEGSLIDSDMNYFNDHGYLSYNLDENLVVLTLNTVPYSPNHLPDTTDQADPFGQFEWLNTTLLELRNSSKFAYIVGHIPPIIDAQDGSPMWGAAYIATYKQIVTKFTDVIKAQLFGHTHSIEFRLPLTEDMDTQAPEDVITADEEANNSSQLVPLFMAAAISPIFYNNPAFLVWDFHATTYELLDFTVYGSNISGDIQELDWQPLFKASTAYNVSSLSWSEMNSFVVDAAADSELVQQYYYNSQAQSYLQTSCEDSVCLAWYLCSMMWWSTPEDYTSCLATGSRLQASTASTSASSLAGTLLYASIAMLAMWI